MAPPGNERSAAARKSLQGLAPTGTMQPTKETRGKEHVMRMIGKGILALLAAAVSVTPCAAAADETVSTRLGTVVVVKEAPLLHRVTVGGRPVFTDDVSIRVSTVVAVPLERPQWILVKRETGGTACPASFRVLDVSGDEPVLSQDFGTCSDALTVETMARGIKVTMPRWNGVGKAVWTWKNGQLMGGPKR